MYGQFINADVDAMLKALPTDIWFASNKMTAPYEPTYQEQPEYMDDLVVTVYQEPPYSAYELMEAGLTGAIDLVPPALEGPVHQEYRKESKQFMKMPEPMVGMCAVPSF